MKVKCVVAVLGLVLSTLASADQSGVMFKVVLLKDGKSVASPSVVGEFGREVTVELAQIMKVVAVASAPNSVGHSLTAVKLSVFESGAMQPGEGNVDTGRSIKDAFLRILSTGHDVSFHRYATTGEAAGGEGMRSNNALQLTVAHRGRPALAIDGVLAGVESTLCPAAELDR